MGKSYEVMESKNDVVFHAEKKDEDNETDSVDLNGYNDYDLLTTSAMKNNNFNGDRNSQLNKRDKTKMNSSVQEKDDDDDSDNDEYYNGDDDGSVELNRLDSEDDAQAAVALLKRIFPDESSENLRQLHLSRCNALSKNGNNDKLVSRLSMSVQKQKIEVQLPDDFLRLPPDVAVRRCIGGKWQYLLIQDLQERAISFHKQRYTIQGNNYTYFTKVIPREGKGLGMTLVEERGLVQIHQLVGLLDSGSSDIVDTHLSPTTIVKKAQHPPPGPALQAGIQIGDVVIGLDGIAFAESRIPGESIAKHAVTRIRDSREEPLVIHLLRFHNNNSNNSKTPTTPLPAVVSMPVQVTTPSLLDTSDILSESEPPTFSSIQSDLSGSQSTPIHRNRERIHPFINVMAKSGLIHTYEEQKTESRMLCNFDDRASQWEELASFQIPSQGVFIPLVGVRKAISVRIVNMFQDGDNTAYTVWVYDVESGKEWYAPVRYFRDFVDLRAATVQLYAAINNIPFPQTRSSLILFRSPSRGETNVQKETKCRQLEFFLRTLCALIYKDRLHPGMAEIAIHVQSFLGCDDRELEVQAQLPPETIRIGTSLLEENEKHQTRVREQLKRSIQRYTYRLFLLRSMGNTVDKFVDAVRTRGPRMQDIEEMESQGRQNLKARALQDLTQLQAFLDRVQDLILEGCMEDFESLAERVEYDAIREHIHGTKAKAGYWDRLVREAVREQVEIEIYVPLRSVVSRWLVYGWRHEDMEIQFKIKELRKRPQEFFRIIRGEKQLDWSSVSTILNDGVGLSTLPCVKLRAIVDAAREIFRIASLKSNNDSVAVTEPPDGNVEKYLGADDFLPIFIYCVVHAEMERPCALCVLLRTLCDRINRIGEIGYYLLTFEAAITHCQEVDLTEDRREMQSFLSVPLNDSFE